MVALCELDTYPVKTSFLLHGGLSVPQEGTAFSHG